jgi:tetratricopeptide (TPR) repeat protein
LPLALVIAFAAGCTTNTELAQTTKASTPTNAGAENLTLALDSLRKLSEADDYQPAQRTIFYLNQWLSAEPAAAGAWEPDRLIRSLPRALRELPTADPQKPDDQPWIKDLSKLQFHGDDLDEIQYLQQNQWLHDVAEHVRREPPTPRLKPWLKEIEASVGLPEAEQLATAERLLDWTTRNIQLDSLPPMPKEPLATAGTPEAALPSARGEIGPGYGHTPLEILLYGHGDAQERARIFILLCRQVGIDAVMLAFPEEQSTSRRGWLPAALIGGKLYLFDTALGLPIPGAEGKGIATLDQVRKDLAILRQLDVKGVGEYPVTPSDFKQGIWALIDAEPPALSRRMALLSASMPSATKLALATQPSQIEAAMRKSNSIDGVSLWRVPFDALMYRVGREQRAGNDQHLAAQLTLMRFLFQPDRPLLKGRNLHLQGRFENEDRKAGARSLYLQCRKSDREIDALVTNEFYRKMAGIERQLPENPQQREAAIKAISDVARLEKFYATFWLGLTYFEAGRYDAAIEWLGERTVQVSPPSPWTPAARYNLSRCYEQLGKLDLARQWLESDKDSPQRLGNMVRARMLKAETSSE